jgi:FkbM family methyltransferase
MRSSVSVGFEARDAGTVELSQGGGQRVTPRQQWLYEKLFALRPTQCASLLKRLLRIRRFNMRSGNGCVYWADPVSVFGLQLLRSGFYEPELTELVLKLLRPGDVFIDAGGNEGYFAVLAARVGCAKVHCVEPQTRLLPVIRRNLEINSVSSVSLYPVALSSSDGHTRLFLRPTTNTGASSFFRHWRLGWSSQEVDTQRLDDFVEANRIGKTRLMKIDCEGAECVIVEGGLETLSRNQIEFIVIEYHPEICGAENCRSVHDKLTTRGYLLARVHGIHVYHLPERGGELAGMAGAESNCGWQTHTA